jgi:hypothetical protein
MTRSEESTSKSNRGRSGEPRDRLRGSRSEGGEHECLASVLEPARERALDGRAMYDDIVGHLPGVTNDDELG